MFGMRFEQALVERQILAAGVELDGDRLRVDRHGFGKPGDLHRDVDGDVAARLNEHVALHDRREAAELCGQGVGAGVDVVEEIAAFRPADARDGDAGGVVVQGDLCAGDGELRFVGQTALHAAAVFLPEHGCRQQQGCGERP